MKRLQKIRNILFLTVFTFVITSCNNDDNGSQPLVEENIVELATATADLSNLVAALQRADLVSALEGAGPFTVFAPTNEAFSTFLNDKGFANLEDVPIEVLKQILLNHVISGDSRASNLITQYARTNSNAGPDGKVLSIYIDTSNGVKLNGVSTVTQADIVASNGVVHIVDAVIDLPTVVTFATADSNFSTLTGALTTNTPNTDFVEILSSNIGENTDIPAPYTVFAPINQAFTDLTEIPAEDELTPILLHHVIANANILSTDLTTGLESPATLEGDNLTFPVVSDTSIIITDGSGNSNINILAINIQATNGVIHAIDKIMLPDTTN